MTLSCVFRTTLLLMVALLAFALGWPLWMLEEGVREWRKARVAA